MSQYFLSERDVAEMLRIVRAVEAVARLPLWHGFGLRRTGDALPARISGFNQLLRRFFAVRVLRFLLTA